MRHRIRRGLIKLLAGIISIMVMLDFILYHIDPLGVTRYTHDGITMSRFVRPALHGYQYQDGAYRLNVFRFVIADGFRAVQMPVPDGQIERCHIAFVGDSVTFGWGSNINFVDILARDIPAIVTNAGIPGYSAKNVAAELDAIPADGYVWLIINNDDEYFASWSIDSAFSGRWDSATAIHLTALFLPPQQPVNEARFVQTLTPILERPDVLAFIFEGQRLTDVVQGVFPQVQVIPMYTSRVSIYDGHPGEQGHRQIAASMKDAVMAFAQQRCQP